MATFYMRPWHQVILLAALILISSCAPPCVAFQCRGRRVGAMRFASSPSADRGCKKAKILLQISNTRHRSANLYMNKDDSSDWNLFRRRPSPESDNSMSSYESQYQQYQRSNDNTNKESYITREMEQQVMASARATIDDKTVSRAISSLVADDDGEKRRNGKVNARNLGTNVNNGRDRNSLRDLAGEIQTTNSNQVQNIQQDDSNNNAWDTQQIAIASGITTCLLSPIIIPIIHSLIPPILPFPASISFEGAAFLGALAYIVALGDPTDQSNVIAKTTSGGMLGDGVEVTGAVSRIVGRTALQSVQISAPRLKAVARAVVDYDNTVNTMEEMKDMQYQLSRRLLELESENDVLRREVALWNAVEDVSSAYKLEELKEIARVNGVRGYSSDGKTALLRRLLNEKALDLDLSPYYRNVDEVL